LQNGLPEEEDTTKDGTLSLLYKTSKPGGNNWIQSITTIASPHDGSPMDSKTDANFTAVSQQMLTTFALAAGISSLDVDWLYDFDLEQFGLQRGSGESFKSYFQRVFDGPMFKPGFVDSASFDLRADSCKTFNNKTELTYPGTYYFTVSTSQTFACSFDGDQCPDWDMEIFLVPSGWSAGHLGDKPLCLADGYCFRKSEWSENDGLVPRRSSRGPENGIRNFVAQRDHPRTCAFFKCRWDNSNLMPGVWYTR
jgi:triacylglycerol lipase